MSSLSLPTGRRGQIVASGLTVLVLATIWWGAVSPLVAWYEDRADWLVQRGALLRHMNDLAATLPELRHQASAAPADGAARPDMLLQGSSDATAGAALQQRVQDMAAKAGVSLATVETLPVRPAGGLRRIALRVTTTAPWPAVVHLLQAIEQADPRLSVDELQLRTGANLVHPQGLPISASFAIIAFRAGEAS
jgi:general secretion pathway protein M